MIAFEFYFKGKRCITQWLNWANIKVGNGYSIDIEIDVENGGELWKDRGYLMIDKDNCYVDVCEDARIDEFESVIEHCPITATKMDGYDQTFVEQFHPNYNCDKIAWLDDCYCALDNEIDNHAHWHYLSRCVVRKVWEKTLCEKIYDLMVYGKGEKSINTMLKIHHFADIADFGKYLSNQYEEIIRDDIAEYEGDIMEQAIDEFEYEMNIDEV